MSDVKWKSSLLSSSYPLEFEVAQILIKNKYAVEGEFPYKRIEDGNTKEFSVDIKALNCLNETNNVNANDLLEINLLIECKYRVPKTNWIFLPEINSNHNYTPDSKEGSAFNIVDQFSYHYFDNSPMVNFEKQIPKVWKGVEVKSDSANDKEIKRGIYQLRYALPYFFEEKIDFNLLRNEFNIPFLVCPILITTADLYVLKKDCKVESVTKAEKVEDVATKVPYLVSFYPLGPDFLNHSQAIFKEFDEETPKGVFEYFNGLRTFGNSWETPVSIYNGFYYGNEKILNQYCSKVIICSLANFEDWLKKFHRSILKLKNNISYTVDK